MDPHIRAAGLTKTFSTRGNEVAVLDGLDLEVQQGEFTALMGPSGSGKSTLLNLVAGLDQPTSGQLDVLGHDIAGMGPKRRAQFRADHVGYIFQLYNLIPVLTAAQNVELPLRLTPLGKRDRAAHVATALEIVGLSDRATHLPGELSGGQAQRVAIARAIAADTDILLCDEPTGDLDAASAAEVMDLLRRLHTEHGKTILLVTHDPHAAQCAGRVLHLDKGVLGVQPA